MSTARWILAGRVDRLLAQADAATGVAARRYALDAVAEGLLLADPGTVTEDDRAAAARLGVDRSAIEASRTAPLPHAVPVPFADGEGALLRQLYVTYDPLGGADGVLGPRARRAVEEALAAASARVAPPRGVAFRFAAARPDALGGVDLEGASLGAAAFLSAVALFGGRSVRRGVALTGRLAGPRLVSVGDLDAKIAAAREHPAITTLLVPAGAPPSEDAALRVVPVADLDAVLRAGLADAPRRRTSASKAMDEARRQFATAWRGFRWPSVVERLERVASTVPEGRLDLRVEVLTRLGAARRHLGDPERSLRLLDRAVALVGTEEGRLAVPDAPLAYLYQQRAMTLRQLSRFGPASAAARRGVRVARRARLRGELIKALGCAGLVAMARGRLEEAVDAFAEALAVQERHAPERTVRSRAYLVEALASQGRLAEADAHYEAALEALPADPAERRSSEAWLRTNYASGLAHHDGTWSTVRELLEADAVTAAIAEEPLPGLLARRHLGRAWARTGQVDRGTALLADSPVVYGLGLEPHLRFLGHLNVLHEASERLALGAWGRDIAGRAGVALRALPAYAEADLRTAIEGVRPSLERGRPPGARALARLLARAARLA
jgi:tetratricopeptide (TPR) repeat protein